MAYNVTQLITDAFYTSGIVSREFQGLDASQINDGLQFLNDVITDKTVENDMIPYYLELDGNFIQGQEEYFIPNLIEIDTLVFYIDSVRYQMTQLPRILYFGSSRANNIQSLPFTYHVERCFGGANVFLYFLPVENFAYQMFGLFRLQSVGLDPLTGLMQDLSLTLDQFYITYLKYALARRICIEYAYDIPAGLDAQVKRYEFFISKKSQQLDLRGRKISTLTSDSTLNYAAINLGRGWTI